MAEGRAIDPDRMGEVSRGHIRRRKRAGIERGRTHLTEGPNGRKGEVASCREVEPHPSGNLSCPWGTMGMNPDLGQGETTLLLRHSLIEEYMDALGQLAADEVVTYDKEVDSLGKAAKEAKFVDEKEQTAFQTVAKILLKAATDAWRQGKVKTFVRESNTDIKVVIGGLKQIVDQGFLGDVQDEKEAIRKYYQRIISESTDKAGIAALTEWRETRIESLAKREKAIEAYSLSLEKIAEGHQKLYDGVLVDSIRSKELLGQLSRYAKDLRKAYDVINSL